MTDSAALFGLFGFSPAWMSVLITVGLFVALLFRRDMPCDLLFLGGLALVVLLGIISPEEALAGFANSGVITVGALFIVAAGLRNTGVLDWVGNRLLGSARTGNAALVRLAMSLVPISAFINNTPVVAMFMPVVLDWCRKRGVSPSRLLIPLSYLTILGGICTLIGTSTNVIADGLLKEASQAAAAQDLYTPAFRHELRQMTLFEIGKVGFPCAVLGSLWLLLIGRRMLPNRTDLIDQFDERRREYLVELLVQPSCRLVGKNVEEAGLRHLRGLFLVEIDRGDEVITPVTPEDVLRAEDHLIFSGVVTTIVDLVKIPGIVPIDADYDVQPQRRQRHLTEAVISQSSPLIGTTVREANFRQLYNAAVVAVHRNGSRLPNKIGDIVLEAGDTLLLQTRTEFASTYRHSRDFFLVAGVEGSQPRQHDRAWLALGLVGLLIAWLAASNWFSGFSSLAGFGAPVVAALTIAVLMVATRCLPIADARAALDMHVLLTIAAALGLGRALTNSGADEGIANFMVVNIGPQNPYLLLIALYLMSMAFTEVITNSATTAMLFPLAVAMAHIGDYSPRPFVMAITLAASMSFLSPIGYQTNLMVMGPGGYHPRDYFRVGWSLTLVVATISLILIPRVWPF
jgi:di/tricarboxylate transporter